MFVVTPLLRFFCMQPQVVWSNYALRHVRQGDAIPCYSPEMGLRTNFCVCHTSSSQVRVSSIKPRDKRHQGLCDSKPPRASAVSSDFVDARSSVLVALAECFITEKNIERSGSSDIPSIFLLHDNNEESRQMRRSNQWYCA